MKKKIISTLTAMCMAASAVGTLAVSAVDLSEPGHDIFSPIEIEMNEEFSESNKNSLHDWYSFTLDQPSKINFTLIVSDWAGNRHYQLVDLDNDNKVISSGNIDKSTINRVFYLASGTYGVDFYNDFNWSFNYKAKLTSTPAEESFDGKSNNNIGKASEIELDTEYSGIIANNDTADYYKFDVEEEGQITLNFDGDMSSVDWKIYNDKEKVIESGRFTKGASDDMISAMKSYVSTGGTYYLALTSADNNCGSYTVSVDYRKDYNDISISDLFACADVNKDHAVDASDASLILAYYAYVSTGGTITDINEWLDKQ